jgi:hypothetical protein
MADDLVRIPAEVRRRAIEIGGWSPDGMRDLLGLLRRKGEPQCFAMGEGNWDGMRCPYKARLFDCCGKTGCNIHHEDSHARTETESDMRSAGKDRT